MKKFPFKISDFFSFLAVGGLWLYYRTAIIQKTDELFLSLFGKNLTGRNIIIQIAVFGGLFLLCVLLPILLDRLIRRNSKYSRLADSVILLILAVPAVQLMVICANQVLRRDDYWEIADARKYGFPGSMFYEIRTWNGRYTGWGLRSLHAVLPNIPYIDIFLFLTLILLMIGASMLAYRLLGSQSSVTTNNSDQRIKALTIGAGITLAFVLLSSNIWEFWFWGSGTMIYGFGIAMCVLTVALVMNVIDKPSTAKMILPAVTCFLTCGCSELCTASLAAFLLIILIRERVTTKKWNRRVLFFLGEICLLFISILLLSGTLSYAGSWGNSEQSGNENILIRLIKWLPGAVGWALNGLYGYTFIKSRELLVFLCVAFLVGTSLTFDKKAFRSYLILAVLLAVIGHCVLLINTLLNYVPPRVITVGICWFVSTMALISMLLGAFLVRGKPRWNVHVKMIFCALLLCLLMNRFYSENISEIRNIRHSWNVRNTLLEQYKGENEPVKTCSLPSPGSFREDILDDPADEFNKAAALFYEIPEISADHRCPPWGESFLPEDRYN